MIRGEDLVFQEQAQETRRALRRNEQLTMNEYGEKAMVTSMYGEGAAINYPILGLVGEAGELANKYKKVLRDDKGVMTKEKRNSLIDELGDVLWYCAALARDLDTDMESVARRNIEKLVKRRESGTIHGSGDNR